MTHVYVSINTCKFGHCHSIIISHRHVVITLVFVSPPILFSILRTWNSQKTNSPWKHPKGSWMMFLFDTEMQSSALQNFVAQQSCLGNWHFSIGKHAPNKHVISRSLFIALTLYQMCQVNDRKRKRKSWACKQALDQSQLGNRARNCWRIEIVSIVKVCCSTLQILGNSQCQATLWATKLHDKVT